MAFASSISWSSHNTHHSSVASTVCTSTSRTVTQNNIKPRHSIDRRITCVALVSSLVLAATSNRTATGFEFRMTVPDQTAAEAQSVIRDHAQALLDVKTLLDEEDWREAQRELRRTSGYLRQDIYTIIQSKDGNIRPLLRKLYSDLFNNVTQLDYAARAKDVAQVREYYNNVATVLKDILSRF
ncbi:hypothetical protein RND81_04G038000 [Saponaria officinalis]|uniref:PsbQ-like protein 3, chloroplastic n=1 Tax=Saponaria officinalis TaxID=3572 RepID=A0AAW1LCV3_SAPOF